MTFDEWYGIGSDSCMAIEPRNAWNAATKESANALEAQANEIDRLETKVDQLEWENKGVAEWRDVAKEYRALCDQLGEALEFYEPFDGEIEALQIEALTAWRNSASESQVLVLLGNM